LTADLERRDAVVAAEIDRVVRLTDGAREIAARARAIAALLDSAPAEHASLDRAEAEALVHRQAADDDLAAAVAALEAVGRKAHETLGTSERAARADVPNLVADASAIAAELADLPRVSSSGRALPGSSVAELVEWDARVHAALLVVRGQLDVERDRLVREANELGYVVLGEQLAGNSVELVGKRVRSVLAG